MIDDPFNPDLVRERMKALGATQTDMAKVAGLPSQSAFHNVLTGKRRITAHEASRIYTYLGIEREPSFRYVPVIGTAGAGNWREAIEMPMGRMPVPMGIGGERCFGIEVDGDSMDKLIEDGGFALIDPDEQELRQGSCYLIRNGNNEATVKMYRRDPARFEPCSTNPQHRSYLVSEADFSIIGKVVWRGGPLP